MKIAAINIICGGSTGKIMLQVMDCARRAGHEVLSFSRMWKGLPPEPADHHYFGSYLENGLHHVLTEVTGMHGVYSFFGTRELVRALEKWQPDVLHLHNLHGGYIDFPMLFRYIKKNHVRVVWTLHDCWAFAGKCAYFSLIQCEKWKTGCHDCPQLGGYPSTRVDASKRMWNLKKKCFTGIEDMTIVTPSVWLSHLVRQSFLNEYPVQVIYNGIDLTVFHPVESNFRKMHGLEHKKLVLGVSFGWERRKGLDVFIELAKELPEEYRIVLVGTDDSVDAQLPENMISIHRTQNQQELAEIYSAADVFVNPTREEVLGMVNVEALACGVPVITFDTGGSPETIDASCGMVIESNATPETKAAILRVCEEHPFTKEACLRRAAFFDCRERFPDYIALFENGVSHE